MLTRVYSILNDALGNNPKNFIADNPLAEAKRKSVAYLYLYLVECHQAQNNLPDEVKIIRHAVAHNVNSSLYDANQEGLWAFFDDEIKQLKSLLGESSSSMEFNAYGMVRFNNSKSVDERLVAIRIGLSKIQEWAAKANDSICYKIALIFEAAQLGELQYDNYFENNKHKRKDMLDDFKSKYKNVSEFLDSMKIIRDEIYHPKENNFDFFMENISKKVLGILKTYHDQIKKLKKIIVPIESTESHEYDFNGYQESDFPSQKTVKKWKDKLTNYNLIINELNRRNERFYSYLDENNNFGQIKFKTGQIQKLLRSRQSEVTATMLRNAKNEFDLVVSRYHRVNLRDMLLISSVEDKRKPYLTVDDVLLYMKNNQVILKKASESIHIETPIAIFESLLFVAFYFECDDELVQALTRLNYSLDWAECALVMRYFFSKMDAIAQQKLNDYIFQLLEAAHLGNHEIPSGILYWMIHENRNDYSTIARFSRFIDVNKTKFLPQYSLDSITALSYFDVLVITSSLCGSYADDLAFLDLMNIDEFNPSRDDGLGSPLHRLCSTFLLNKNKNYSPGRIENLGTAPLPYLKKFLDVFGADVDCNVLDKHFNQTAIAGLGIIQKFIYVLDPRLEKIYFEHVEKLKLLLGHPSMIEKISLNVSIQFEATVVNGYSKEKDCSMKTSFLTICISNSNCEMVEVIIDAAKKRGIQVLESVLKNFMMNLTNKTSVDHLARRSFQSHLIYLKYLQDSSGQSDEVIFSKGKNRLFDMDGYYREICRNLLMKIRNGLDISSIIEESKRSFQAGYNYVMRANYLLKRCQWLEKRKQVLANLPESAKARLFDPSKVNAEFNSVEDCNKEIERLLSMPVAELNLPLEQSAVTRASLN